MGKRSIILSDLSPIATFISYAITNSWDSELFQKESSKLLSDAYEQLGYFSKQNTQQVYKTMNP